MVLQRTSAVRLGNNQHIGHFHLPIAVEHHVLNVRSTVGEKLPAGETAVLVVVYGLDALQDGAQVTFGAKHLFGAESAINVCAARTRERSSINQHGFALRLVQCGNGECSSNRGFGCLCCRLGQIKSAGFAVFVDSYRFDCCGSFLGKNAFHKGKMLCRLRSAFFFRYRHGTNPFLCLQGKPRHLKIRKSI